MRLPIWAAAFAATCYLALPAPAWNGTGHRIVAAIAYERLTPQARARVDEMIRHHPDYASLLTEGAPADEAGRARAAFLFAATWPDVIKADRRFYDDTRKNATPTAPLPGFPDTARHTNWHYIDVPYAPDGAEPEEIPVPNALTELKRLLPEMSASPPDSVVAAYDLPWIEHLIGDLAQPLHCTSRFLKSQAILNPQPKGDAGGNEVFASPGRNLHAFWDDLAGTNQSDEYVAKLANEIAAEHPAPGYISKNPRKWIDQAFKLDKSDVYSFGLETGSREHPVSLTANYRETARRIAHAQLALAGYRLAAVLNAQLK